LTPIIGSMNSRAPGVPKRAAAVLILTLAALPVLAWLQFSWTEETSRAQAFQMKQRLDAAGAQVASTLEVERLVIREYVHDLRLPRQATGARPRQAVADALKFWAARTRTPQILKGVWIVGSDGADYLDAASGQWSAVPSTQVPPDIRAMVPAPRGSGRDLDPDLFSRGFFPAEPVRFDPFLLMVPDANLDAVVRDLIPDLVSQAFGGPQGMADFSVTVRDNATGQVIYQRGPAPASDSPAALTEALWSFEESWGGTGGRPVSPLLKLWLHQTEDHSSRWTLEVRHVNGPIAGVFEQIRWTNLAVSLTLLLVLVTGLVLLFALYSRSRRMVRSQKSFVASVSHELRTPLAVLRAAAENMKEGLVREPSQAIRYGTRLLEESDRLLQMTENVLWYSGIGSQRVTIGDRADRWTSVDWGSLVTQTAATWTEAFERAGAVLDVRVPEGSLTVLGDRGALKAIIDNLLSNALRYGVPQEGRVEVSVSRVEVRRRWAAPVTRVRLQVRDHGPGIRPAERRRVFEPFYQTSSGVQGGIGLGLSLVQRIAAAHGGEARIEPTRGRGTSVQVDLPPEVLP